MSKPSFPSSSPVYAAFLLTEMNSGVVTERRDPQELRAACNFFIKRSK